jgi:hypothetical protein
MGQQARKMHRRGAGCIPLFCLHFLLVHQALGQAGLEGFEIEEPDNEAPWPKEDDWILVIDSQSQLHCPMGKNLQCDTASTIEPADPSASIDTLAKCIQWCPTKKTTSFSENGGTSCQWDGTTSTCSHCLEHKLIESTDVNFFAGICEPNIDFVYSSPLWHAKMDDFNVVDPTNPNKLIHPYTTGSNKFYQDYCDIYSGGVTHVRIEMNNKKVDVAVAVSLAGRYSLKDLVTNPGGSESSVKGDAQAKNEQRGAPGSPFSIASNGFTCTNIGFNHLQAGGGEWERKHSCCCCCHYY